MNWKNEFLEKASSLFSEKQDDNKGLCLSDGLIPIRSLRRVSTTLDRDFCIDALNKALEKHGPSEIFNTNQGSQDTSDEFTGILNKRQMKISMDGKGLAPENVFVERRWRTVKQDEVYLKGDRNA